MKAENGYELSTSQLSLTLSVTVSLSPNNPCLYVHELPGVAVPVVTEEHGPRLAEEALRQSLARINFSYRRTAAEDLIFFLKRIFAKLYYLEFGAWFV